jgi:hypothetical protein
MEMEGGENVFIAPSDAPPVEVTAYCAARPEATRTDMDHFLINWLRVMEAIEVRSCLPRGPRLRT